MLTLESFCRITSNRASEFSPTDVGTGSWRRPVYGRSCERRVRARWNVLSSAGALVCPSKQRRRHTTLESRLWCECDASYCSAMNYDATLPREGTPHRVGQTIISRWVVAAVARTRSVGALLVAHIHVASPATWALISCSGLLVSTRESGCAASCSGRDACSKASYS